MLGRVFVEHAFLGLDSAPLYAHAVHFVPERFKQFNVLFHHIVAIARLARHFGFRVVFALVLLDLPVIRVNIVALDLVPRRGTAPREACGKSKIFQ